MTTEVPMAEAAARYLAGEPSTALARDYGVTPATMRRKLVRAGVTMRAKGGRRKLNKDDEARMLAQFLAGEKQEVLCLEYGVKRSTVCRVLRNAGVSKTSRRIEGVHILGGVAVKRCSSCWATKPLSAFGDDCSKKDGMRSNCKECERRCRNERTNRVHA